MNAKYQFPWARFLLSLIGILIIMGVWRWSVQHLYALPEYTMATFQAITISTLYTVSAIVVFAVTCKMIWDWKNSTASEAVTTAAHVVEERFEHAAKPEHFDNGTI